MTWIDQRLQDLFELDSSPFDGNSIGRISSDGVDLEARMISPTIVAFSVPLGMAAGQSALLRLGLGGGLAERGGGYFALDGDTIRLETRLAAGPDFDGKLDNFLRRAVAWREIMDEGLKEAPASANAAGPDPEGWIRG